MEYLNKGLFSFLLFASLLQPLFSQKDNNILVFTKTNGYRHASIEDGIQALKNFAKEESWSINFTEDSLMFNEEELDHYDAVIFMNTTGDILGNDQEKAFEEFIKKGRGFVGIHAASDTEYDWEFYSEMIGAQFLSHPKVQEAKLHVNYEIDHPAINHLEHVWIRKDEWYNFKTQPAEYLNVLISIDENSIEGKKMNQYHPICWYHSFHNSRIFYTGMGHTPESYYDEIFLTHLKEAIKWALND